MIYWKHFLIVLEPKIAKTVDTVIDPEQPNPTPDEEDFGDDIGTCGEEEDSPEEGEEEIVEKTQLKCMVCDKFLSSQQNLMKVMHDTL